MPQISIYDPRTMAKLVVRMPPVKTFIKSTFFRNIETFNTKKVDFDVKKGNRQLAPFVHKKIGSETVENSGYSTYTYEPPLVAPDTITTTDDILSRSPGEGIYTPKNPNQRAVEKMLEDFRKLNEMITRREEWMCCQALFSGKIEVIGKGLKETINFGFTNTENLKGTKCWNKTASDKLGDLDRWKKQVQKTGYLNTNICLMGSAALNDFLNDEAVQKRLDLRRAELAVIKPKELPSGATYVGTLVLENVDIYTYNEYYLDDWTDPEKPEEKPLLPENLVCMLSTEAENTILYGAVPIVDDKGKSIGVAEGTRIPDQWVERKPARRFFQLSSCPLPVPKEVNSWYVAHVRE